MTSEPPERAVAGDPGLLHPAHAPVPSSPVTARGNSLPPSLVPPSGAGAGPQSPGPPVRAEALGSIPGARTWILALPPGLEPLSLNQRLHWAEQRRRAAELKKAAWAVAKREKVPRLGSARVTVVYHPPDRRRRDHDNTPAVMGKHAVDGIVAAGVLADDCPPNIAGISYAIGEVVRGGQLVLHLSEVLPPRGEA